MKFESNWAFYLLFILPVIIFLILFEYRKKRAGLKLFADPDLLPVLTRPIKRGIIFLKGLFLVIAVFFIILACAGPRWGFHLQEVQRRGVDIVFLLDVSASMLAEDVKPDRLERAKREITDFLKIAAGDRIGLVLFAGDAFVQCPLTLDYDAIAMFLGSVGVDTLPVQGTDMGQGIKTALNAFDFKSAIDKVIVMITDGEDNEGRGLQQADKAMDKGVKIFVYGIGEPSGAPIPDETGGFKKDKIGNLILSKLNEKDLRRIAKATDGRYVRSVTGDLDLDRLYFEGIKIKTEAKELESGKIKIFEERFYIFIWIAFLFLVMEGLIGLKPGHAKLFSIMVVLIICHGNSVWANENPEKLYQQGHYQKAEQAFIKKDMDHPKDVRNRYNRGCASFQNANYEGASAAFRSALKRTDDKQISFSSAYNLGNSLFKQGDFQGAAQAFKQAIKINPGDEDSKYNYGLALKTIEENQKKEKEKQQKNQEQDQNQEQEQEQNKAQDKKNKNDKKKDDPHKQQNKNQDNQKQDSGQNDQSRNKQEQGESAEQTEKSSQPEQNAGTSEEYQSGAMSKNEAEAFLDNIGEDPAAINRLRFHGKKQKTASGKDW
ncbi:MAG: VWA domain-containing protein [Thermodesulfobacteriota bacterium]|nr:VWA domain-containing protein [Thermodesulfobacteriota bacterium]